MSVKVELRCFALPIVLMLAGCGSGSASKAPDMQEVSASVAALDPVFAGEQHLLDWLRKRPDIVKRGDEADRERAMAWAAAHRASLAPALVAELLDPELAKPVLRFLQSDAGRAACQAEVTLLAAFPQNAESFATAVTTVFADPDRVGSGARTRFDEASRAFAARDGSMSPLQLAPIVAALSLKVSDAVAIRDFYQGDVGARWLEIRKQALPRARKVYDSFLSDMKKTGLAVAPMDDLDVFLPTGK